MGVQKLPLYNSAYTDAAFPEIQSAVAPFSQLSSFQRREERERLETGELAIFNGSLDDAPAN